MMRRQRSLVALARGSTSIAASPGCSLPDGASQWKTENWNRQRGPSASESIIERGASAEDG